MDDMEPTDVEIAMALAPALPTAVYEELVSSVRGQVFGKADPQLVHFLTLRPIDPRLILEMTLTRVAGLAATRRSSTGMS